MLARMRPENFLSAEFVNIEILFAWVARQNHNPQPLPAQNNQVSNFLDVRRLAAATTSSR